MLKRVLYYAIIMLLVSCKKSTNEPAPTPVAPSEVPPFKVATYNMRVDVPSDKYPWSTVRKQRAIDIIRKYEFDIFGTQELYYHQVQDVLKAPTANVYDHVGLATGDGKPNGQESFDAIFYRRNRFDLISTGDFWYSDTPNEPSLSWGAAVKTHCTWAKFKDKKNNKEFFVFNSHLIFDHEIGQLKSVDILKEKMNNIAKGYPIFCLGDFNSDPSTTAIKTLLGDRKLFDSKMLTTNLKDSPKGGTFSGFEANMNANWRIDLILVTSLIKVIRYQVIQDDFESEIGVASDHLPVMVEVRL